MNKIDKPSVIKLEIEFIPMFKARRKDKGILYQQTMRDIFKVAEKYKEEWF